MVERIEAWLRARDAKRFQHDMHKSADSIEDVGDEAALAGAKSRVFREETNQLEKAIRGVRVSIGPFSLGIKQLTAIALTGAPAIASLSGSIIALGASAGAAMLGGGLIGGAGLAAMIAGLSGMVIIGKSTADNLKKITTAQEAYTLAVAQHGKWSDEALKAQDKLNAVVEVNGGRAALKAVRAWDKLGNTFQKLTGPARQAMFAIANNGIGAATSLLPTFASETNKTAQTVRKSLKDAFADLSGGEMRGNIRAFSGAFRSMVPDLTGGGTDFLVGLLRVLRATLPYVKEFASGFADVGHNFRAWSSDGKAVSSTVDMLVGHFKAWWNLIKALGRTIGLLFGASERQGKDLVQSITGVVNKFNDWLASAEGARSATRFFDESISSLKAMGRALEPVVQVISQLSAALLPALESGSDGVSGVLRIMAARATLVSDALRILGPLAGPLVQIWLAWKAATLLLNAAQLIWRGTLFVLRGAILAVRAAAIAWTAVQWALNVALSANPIGAIIVGVAALAAGFVYAYTKVEWFRNGVNAVINFIKEHWKTLVAAIPFIGPVLWVVVNHFKTFKQIGQAVFGAIKSAIHAVKSAIQAMIGAIKDAIGWIGKMADKIRNTPGIKQVIDAGKFGAGVVGGAAGAASDAAGFLTGGLIGGARGGDVPMGRSALVGENGPEVVRNEPTRVRVQPLTPTVPPISMAGILGGNGEKTTTVVVQLDGREIARAVAKDTDDRIARR